MRKLLALSVILVVAYWQRPVWQGWFEQAAQTARPPATPAKVYQWRDEQGLMHYGDRPAHPEAREANLPALTVVPASRPVANTQPADPTAPVAQMPCSDDAAAQQACARRQVAPRNLAIERIEAAIKQP